MRIISARGLQNGLPMSYETRFHRGNYTEGVQGRHSVYSKDRSKARSLKQQPLTPRAKTARRAAP